MNINPIKAITREYVPMRMNASPAQRDELLQQMVKRSEGLFNKGKKRISIQDIQSHLDITYPNQNITMETLTDAGLATGATMDPKINNETNKVCGSTIYMKFKNGSIKNNMKNKIMFIHELSHSCELSTNPKLRKLDQKLLSNELQMTSNRLQKLYFAESGFQDDINRTYSSIVYPRVMIVFKPKKFEKEISKALECHENSDKITFLKVFAFRLNSEIKAYKNGIQIGGESKNPFQYTQKILLDKLVLGNNGLHLDKRLKVTQKMLADAIQQERKTNAEKLNTKI